jgi:hypothetical protein
VRSSRSSEATDREPGGRFDLAAIEAALRTLQREFPSINPQLRDRRDPINDTVIENLMTGYAYVDELVAEQLDIFAMGNLKHLLELNYRVLCGVGEAQRQNSAEHLRLVEEHFYDAPGAGIRDIVEWHSMHRGNSVWRRAAGVYIRVLSEPQLFIEGNHRSGALIVSYLLGRDGKPPFVLTPANAREFFDPSSLIKKIDKRHFLANFRIPHLKERFARFLKQQSDDTYLRR